jgi:DNA adenine methylase
MSEPLVAPAIPAFPWMGGKQWFVEHARSWFPRAGCYVEPFAGAASVLLGLPPSQVEILNDRNGDLVHFYRTMQNPEQRGMLLEKLEWTVYARGEFERALIMMDDNLVMGVDRAWAFFVVANCAFSGGGQNALTASRFAASTQRSQGRRLQYHIDGLKGLADRLSNVVVENRDAADLLDRYDSMDTLFFLDPPYHPGTRNIRSEKDRGQYAGGEMTAENHQTLIEKCVSLDGMVAICGYAHDDYDGPLRAAGWETIRYGRKALSSLHHDGERAGRDERVWINVALARRRKKQCNLFDVN